MLREAMGRLSAAETQTTVQTRQRLMAVLKVLIVGGDASLRATARPVLERQGFAVAVAETGATALRLAETERPSLILLNLRLPDGDGLEVAERLRANAPTSRIPLVVLTDEVVLGRRAETLARVCTGTIPTPVTPERLRRDIDLLLKVGRRSIPRRFPRHAVEATGWFRVRGAPGGPEGPFVPAAIRTVSEGGVRMDVRNPIPVASPLELRLGTPEGEITAFGKVIYSRFEGDARPGGGAYQHGVQFTELPPPKASALKRLIEGNRTS